MYYFSRLEKGIYSDLMVVLRQVDTKLVPFPLKSARIGEVKDFGSIIQMGQQLGVPLAAVGTATVLQRQEARTAFSRIANTIVKRTGRVQ